MTQRQCLELLRELRALERLDAAICAHEREAASFDWRVCLTAIRDRLAWGRYCLSLEDPVTVGSVDEMEQSERQSETTRTTSPAPMNADVPPGRVH